MKYHNEIRKMPVLIFKTIWVRENTNRLPWAGHQVIREDEWPDLQLRVAKFVEALGDARDNNS